LIPNLIKLAANVDSCVSILHKVPVTLRTKIAFPNMEDTDEAHVLFAFQKFIELFWTFDQSGVFELLDNADFDISALGQSDASKSEALESARRQLDENRININQISDVQAVDISVTRQWMRIILWRLSESHGLLARSSSGHSSSLYDPIEIARELLAALANMPDTVIEAHGPGLVSFVKLYMMIMLRLTPL
jgi:hypothetical protein